MEATSKIKGFINYSNIRHEILLWQLIIIYLILYFCRQKWCANVCVCFLFFFSLLPGKLECLGGGKCTLWRLYKIFPTFEDLKTAYQLNYCRHHTHKHTPINPSVASGYTPKKFCGMGSHSANSNELMVLICRTDVDVQCPRRSLVRVLNPSSDSKLIPD